MNLKDSMNAHLPKMQLLVISRKKIYDSLAKEATFEINYELHKLKKAMFSVFTANRIQRRPSHETSLPQFRALRSTEIYTRLIYSIKKKRKEKNILDLNLRSKRG